MIFSPPAIESFAGLTAGIATTLAVHPLDLLKTRLQVDRNSAILRGSSVRVAQRILRDEGGIPALYRGLGPNLVGNSLSWALYFFLYSELKSRLTIYRGKTNGLSYYDYFLASGTAGVLTSICTNPIWVIKTRTLSTSSQHAGAYTSIQDGTRRIYRQDGLAGFYRGLIPSLFGVSHGTLQFMAYEQMKKLRSYRPNDPPGELTNVDYLLFSGLSKVLAGTATYPYQVVRARLQMYDAASAYNSARDVIWKIWQNEGASAFYKGLLPNLVRVVPSSCVTFLVYENTKQHLPKLLL